MQGQKSSCPQHSQGEVEMVKKLHPMLFHNDVTGRESIAAELVLGCKCMTDA